jgi:hypothetical protein
MTPSEASTIINSVFGLAPAGDESPDSAVAVVSRLAYSGRIIEFLCAIRDNPALVKHCAPMSYRHPLGFEKIVLMDAQPQFLLRMHAWRPGGEPGVEHIHNHRFMMATAVLRGYYNLQVFQPCRSGTPMVEYRETTGTDGRSWCLDTVGIRNLQLLTSARVSHGGGYALAADALHRVTVPNGTLCITLFLAALASTGVAPQTRIFSAPGNDVPAQTQVKPLSGDEYRRWLDKITEDLTALPKSCPSPLLDHGAVVRIQAREVINDHRGNPACFLVWIRQLDRPWRSLRPHEEVALHIEYPSATQDTRESGLADVTNDGPVQPSFLPQFTNGRLVQLFPRFNFAARHSPNTR